MVSIGFSRRSLELNYRRTFGLLLLSVIHLTGIITGQFLFGLFAFGGASSRLLLLLLQRRKVTHGLIVWMLLMGVVHVRRRRRVLLRR